MTITRISSATNNGTGVTLGSHAKGDTIVYVAYNATSATTPTLPASVIGRFFRARLRIGFYIADSSNESVGTSGWTNASNLIAVVYRPSSGNIIIPEYLSTTSATSATIQYPGQDAGSFAEQVTDQWVLGYAGQQIATNNIAGNPPTGMANVTGSTGSGFEVALHDTNATRTTIWNTVSTPLATSAAYLTAVFGLLEIETKIAAGGGFRPANIRGGADQ